ncbi:hypothetical protein [Bordetella flabilis]|uniref:hypothetical protein n=1 Tax=Bordetella flabilis TaxID=463014 RepID=UPI000AB10B1F|nr:hypothetical protein [Bordetella flabilis]
MPVTRQDSTPIGAVHPSGMPGPAPHARRPAHGHHGDAAAPALREARAGAPARAAQARHGSAPAGGVRRLLSYCLGGGQRQAALPYDGAAHRIAVSLRDLAGLLCAREREQRLPAAATKCLKTLCMDARGPGRAPTQHDADAAHAALLAGLAACTADMELGALSILYSELSSGPQRTKALVQPLPCKLRPAAGDILDAMERAVVRELAVRIGSGHVRMLVQAAHAGQRDPATLAAPLTQLHAIGVWLASPARPAAQVLDLLLDDLPDEDLGALAVQAWPALSAIDCVPAAATVAPAAELRGGDRGRTVADTDVDDVNIAGDGEGEGDDDGDGETRGMPAGTEQAGVEAMWASWRSGLRIQLHHRDARAAASAAEAVRHSDRLGGSIATAIRDVYTMLDRQALSLAGGFPTAGALREHLRDEALALALQYLPAALRHAGLLKLPARGLASLRGSMNSLPELLPLQATVGQSVGAVCEGVLDIHHKAVDVALESLRHAIARGDRAGASVCMKRVGMALARLAEVDTAFQAPMPAALHGAVQDAVARTRELLFGHPAGSGMQEARMQEVATEEVATSKAGTQEVATSSAGTQAADMPPASTSDPGMPEDLPGRLRQLSDAELGNLRAAAGAVAPFAVLVDKAALMAEIRRRSGMPDPARGQLAALLDAVAAPGSSVFDIVARLRDIADTLMDFMQARVLLGDPMDTDDRTALVNAWVDQVLDGRGGAMPAAALRDAIRHAGMMGAALRQLVPALAQYAADLSGRDTARLTRTLVVLQMACYVVYSLRHACQARADGMAAPADDALPDHPALWQAIANEFGVQWCCATETARPRLSAADHQRFEAALLARADARTVRWTPVNLPVPGEGEQWYMVAGAFAQDALRRPGISLALDGVGAQGGTVHHPGFDPLLAGQERLAAAGAAVKALHRLAGRSAKALTTLMCQRAADAFVTVLAQQDEPAFQTAEAGGRAAVEPACMHVHLQRWPEGDYHLRFRLRYRVPGGSEDAVGMAGAEDAEDVADAEDAADTMGTEGAAPSGSVAHIDATFCVALDTDGAMTGLAEPLDVRYRLAAPAPAVHSEAGQSTMEGA